MVPNHVSTSEENRTDVEEEKEMVDLDIGESTVPFYRSSHLKYIRNLSNKLDSTSSYEGAVTEHLRMSGIYWTYTALSLLVSPAEASSLLGVHASPSFDGCSRKEARPSIVEWVLKCFDVESGGFSGNVGYDGHLLYTLSALQILVIAEYDLNQLDVGKIVSFIASLQQKDGSFAGDKWGEIDTRFTYCALSSLSLLSGVSKGLDSIDVKGAVRYISSCQNLDGGFGSMKGAESHAAQVFCCVGALSIAKSLNVIKEPDSLCWWLAERQCDSGGLNGRPEKQADVCYSWWILSVLSIMDRVDWISGEKLAGFIAKAQDPEDGGIADRPEDMPDIFHTLFGTCGLSLLRKLPDSYRKIDPVYCLPKDVVQRCGLSGQIIRRKHCDERDVQLDQYDVLER